MKDEAIKIIAEFYLNTLKCIHCNRAYKKDNSFKVGLLFNNLSNEHELLKVDIICTICLNKDSADEYAQKNQAAILNLSDVEIE